MKEIVVEYFKQGLPALFFLVATTCLGLGFFEIAVTPTFSVTRLGDIDWRLIILAAFLMILSIALWFADPSRRRVTPEEALNGHSRLIRFLNAFVRAADFRPAATFSENFSSGSATRYAAIYLESLGLLKRNNNGSEYRATPTGTKLLADEKFRLANLTAFNESPLQEDIHSAVGATIAVGDWIGEWQSIREIGVTDEPVDVPPPFRDKITIQESRGTVVSGSGLTEGFGPWEFTGQVIGNTLLATYAGTLPATKLLPGSISLQILGQDRLVGGWVQALGKGSIRLGSVVWKRSP